MAMSTDLSIPNLSVNPIDTAKPIDSMQQAEMAQLQIIKQQYDNATEEEKASAREEMKDVFKIEGMGGDVGALDKFINNPKNLNTQAAMEMRDEYLADQTPDKAQFLNGVKARKNLAVALGFVEDPAEASVSTFAQKLALLNSDPSTANLPAATKLQLAGGKLSEDKTLDQSGGVVPMSGASDAREEFKFVEARGTKSGSGEITDVDKSNQGKQQLLSVTAAMRGKYNELKNAGAAVSTGASSVANIAASARQSGVGQAIGGAIGTPEQGIRNEIQMQIPNLINSIRQATGMSAKTMDSNTELQFYLKMATDPTKNIEANLFALETLEKQYGKPVASKLPPSMDFGGGGATVPAGTTQPMPTVKQWNEYFQ